MAKDTVSVRHVILGLLTQQPMSGYDIKQLFESFNWLIGSPSYGSLYPALHELLDEELVAMEIIPNQDKPARKEYHTTAKGKEVLFEWLQQPATSDTPLKPFLMRLMLADNYSHEGLVGYLHQRRSQVVAYHSDLKEKARNGDEVDDLGQQLIFNYGLAMANAELQWLDRILEQLS